MFLLNKRVLINLNFTLSWVRVCMFLKLFFSLKKTPQTEFCSDGSVRDFRKLKMQSNKFSKVSALQFSSLLGGSFYKGNGQVNSPVTVSKNGEGIGDAEVVRYAIQVSKAVKELHDRRMIHCDLKSDNVMATQNGSILKLGDFGRIQQLDNLTHKGPTGSLGYMAPYVKVVFTCQPSKCFNSTLVSCWIVKQLRRLQWISFPWVSSYLN